MTEQERKSIPPRCYYYLLDFKDSDEHGTIQMLYKVDAISQLRLDQFWSYFQVAANADSREFYKKKS